MTTKPTAPYQFLPPLTDAEYEALRADIAAHGMRHPILVDENGRILDGHHRARIAKELGIKPERQVLAGLTEVEKRDVAFTSNAARRHLDSAGRRAAVVASLKADPELSNRQHARRTGVSHPYVANVRAELVERGEVVTVTTSVGADGKSYAASRPTPQTAAERDISADAAGEGEPSTPTDDPAAAPGPAEREGAAGPGVIPASRDEFADALRLLSDLVHSLPDASQDRAGVALASFAREIRVTLDDDTEADR